MNKLFFLSILAISSLNSVFAQDKACYKDLETDFFQEKLVGEAFGLHNVYQSQWNPMFSALKDNARNVPRIIRSKAQSMQPNPFRPFNSKEAAKLLIDTLYEVFVTTMWQLNFTNKADIDGMFRYIQENQQQRINQCLGIDIEVKTRDSAP